MYVLLENYMVCRASVTQQNQKRTAQNTSQSEYESGDSLYLSTFSFRVLFPSRLPLDTSVHFRISEPRNNGPTTREVDPGRKRFPPARTAPVIPSLGYPASLASLAAKPSDRGEEIDFPSSWPSCIATISCTPDARILRLVFCLLLLTC